jgi:hypothetical protein
MTIKEIINHIETVYNNSILFQSFTVGTIFEFSRDSNILYPSLFVEIPTLDENINEDTSNISFAIVFSDRSNEDYLNQLEIVSRLHQFSKIFMMLLASETPLEFSNPKFLIYEEDANDRCYSCRTEFNIYNTNSGLCEDFIDYLRPTC